MNNPTPVPKPPSKILNWCAAIFVILGLTAIDAGAAQVTLAWDPNRDSDLGGYRLYYGTASRKYTASIDVKNVTTYTLYDLPPWQTYYFALTAYDIDNNESKFSNQIKYYQHGFEGDWSADAEEAFSVSGLGKVSAKTSGMVRFNPDGSHSGRIELVANVNDASYGRYTGPYSVQSNGKKLTWTLDEAATQKLESYLRGWFTEWAQANGLLAALSDIEDFQLTRFAFKPVKFSNKNQTPTQLILRAKGQARGTLGGKLATKKFTYEFALTIIGQNS
jgi:hypothetical protein